MPMNIFISSSFTNLQVEAILASVGRVRPIVRSLDMPLNVGVDLHSIFASNKDRLEDLSFEFVKPPVSYTTSLAQAAYQRALEPFSNAPRLHQLNLAEAKLVYIEPLPLTQITRLELASKANWVAETVRILAQMPRLEHFIVDMEAQHRSMEVPPALPLTMSCLHTLVASNAAAWRLLPHLALPALHTLDLHTGLVGKDLRPLLRLGERSAWPLRTLRLRDTEWEPIVALLQRDHWQNLEELEVSWPVGSLAPLFERITLKEPSVRDIRHLAIRNYRPQATSGEIFVLTQALEATTVKVSLTLVEESDLGWVQETLQGETERVTVSLA